MVELLVVLAIIGSLAAIGLVMYGSSVDSIKTDLANVQTEEVIERVETVTELVTRGVESGLVGPVSGTRITPESTCGEFLDVLQESLPDVRNPFDGLPAITFSTDYDVRQKRGKIRIVCYKLAHYFPANGESCKMKDGGIKVTYFKYHCGGKCGHYNCIYPSGECGDGPVIGSWAHGAQKEKFFGKVENRYVRALDGTIIKTPFGDPMVDVAYAKSVCPGFKHATRPKEADY